jgi:hypothetical protein
VVLAGGVEEARGPAEGNRALGAPGQRGTQRERLGVALAVEIRHEGEVAPRRDRGHQRVEGQLHAVVRGEVDAVEDPAAAAQLDRADDGGRPLVGQPLAEDAGGVLLALGDVGLVERIDAEHLAGDGGGVLPGEELGTQGTGHAEGRAGGGRLAADDGEHHVLGTRSGRVRGLQDDRQDPAALLAGGLRDELLGPVAEAGDGRVAVGEAELVPARLGGGAHRQAQLERRVVGRVEVLGQTLGLVEERAHVRAGQRRGHEAERGEGAVAAADGRVGQEDGAGPHRRGGLRQGRPGVGDDDEARPGLLLVETRVGERGEEGAALALGLHRPARLGADDDDGPLEVGHGGGHLTGVGGVQHDQRHPRRPADHLGRQRRAAHAAQDDPVQPFGRQLGPQVGEPLHQLP